jgi:AraC-like DNA-binding protein
VLRSEHFEVFEAKMTAPQRPSGVPAHELTVAVQVLLALLGRAEQAGLSVSELLARFEIAPDLLRDVDGRVPVAVMRALWLELPERCNDPNFGINLARSAPNTAFGIVAYVAMHAENLERGLTAAVKYVRLLQDVAACSLEPIAETGGLRFVQTAVPGNPVPPRHAVEFAFVRSILMARRSTGVDLVPAQVRFAFPRPADTSAHEELFRSPIVFDHHRNELEFDPATLRLPQRSADLWLHKVVEAHAQAALERLGVRKPFVQQVASALGVAVQQGDGDLRHVARALAMTERTLQRRLAEEGVQFRALVDDVRRGLALRYLADRSMSLTEIALMLGFSEQAAFHRAFVRWTGKTPGHFRRGREPAPLLA